MLVAITMVGLLRTLSNPINHDSAWYLIATARWLDGAELYRDIIEINPPLAFFLTAPPAALAKSLDLLPATAFVLYVFLLIALSLLLIWRILCHLSRSDGLTRQSLLAAALCALTLLPGGDFGQREHLMVIFALPYVALLAARVRGGQPSPSLSLFIGFWAALGFGLKPHFLLVPAALEIYQFLRTRNCCLVLRPETITLAGSLIAYIVIVVIATPDYVTTIIPYGRSVYFAFETDPSDILRNAQFSILLPLLLACAYAGERRKMQDRTLPDTFFLTSLCFLAIYHVQAKGWAYHLYPSLAMMFLAGIACFQSVTEAADESWPQTKAQWCLQRYVLVCVVPLLLLIDAQLIRGRYTNAFLETFTPIVREHASGSSFYVFSAYVSATYPLALYEDVRAVSRYPALWLLPGLARQQAGESAGLKAQKHLHEEITRFAIDTVIDDLQRDPPSLIIVDARRRKGYFGGLDFDYVDFFSRDERFAVFWRSYDLLCIVKGHKIYVRRQEAISSDANTGPGRMGCSTGRRASQP
ncbi:MAG: hypothetical protein ACREDZ_05450 [Kiloniellales bacterium]